MPDNSIRHLASFRISGVMRRFGLTARALRHYEAIGLLEADRDRNNFRCYGHRACRRLEWIAPLRSAGLSLEAIGKVIQAEEDEGRGREIALAVLRARRDELARSVIKVEAAIAANEMAGGRKSGGAPPRNPQQAPALSREDPRRSGVAVQILTAHVSDELQVDPILGVRAV